MFSAMWEQAQNMAEPAEIARVLQPAGLDA